MTNSTKLTLSRHLLTELYVWKNVIDGFYSDITNSDQTCTHQ